MAARSKGAGGGGGGDNRLVSLPLSRIRVIMKSSPEVSSINPDAIFLTAKATVGPAGETLEGLGRTSACLADGLPSRARQNTPPPLFQSGLRILRGSVPSTSPPLPLILEKRGL